MAFKDEKTAMQRSWLIPGGGFFYTGHSFLGVFHGVVELILILIVGYWLLVGLGVTHPAPDPGESPVEHGLGPGRRGRGGSDFGRE